VGHDGALTIVDLRSVNGTRVGGRWATSPVAAPPGAIIELGAVALEVGPPSAPEAVALGPGPRPGTVGYHRPPRAPLVAGPAAIRLPGAPAEPAPGARFGWAALLAPVVMGIGMAVLFNPLMAVFALFSPVMLLGNWLEDKRRVRREKRQGDAVLSTGLVQLADDLVAAGDAERRRRRAWGTGADGACRVALHSSRRLWERRPGHPDFLITSLGCGSVRWSPPVSEGTGARSASVDAALAAGSVIERCPVLVSVRPGQIVGVAGDAQAGAAVARSLALQAAVDSGPADLAIAVVTSPARVAEWDWATWLPHSAAGDDPSGLRLLAAGADDAVAVVAQLASIDRPATLVIVDGEHHLQGRRSPLRDLLGSSDRLSAIVLAASPERLPSSCTTVVGLDGGAGRDGRASLQSTGGGEQVADFVVAGMGVETARQVARALAAFDDPEMGDESSGLPASVALADLLGLGPIDGPELAQRWGAAGRTPRLATPIGLTASGPVVIDLEADGPHGLVAGTTGSGKSELLRSLVAGLAANVSPQALNFVLIDYKGGSAFAECAGLPHTVGMVTDLDEHLGQRALRCLEAELRYREEQLRSAGAADLGAYQADSHRAPLPRLLVVIDEFATMAADIPDFLDSLVGIAQRGRSLGVHLLLATQRPSGAVNDNIRANTNLRLALRVQDGPDSTDVIGSPEAASIDRRVPGRALLRLGPGDLTMFQAALASATRRPAAGDRPLPVQLIHFGPDPTPVLAPRSAALAPDAGAQTQTDLVRVVEAARAAAGLLDLPAMRRPWPEPLPSSIELRAGSPGNRSSTGPPHQSAAVIGVVDEPDRQRQRPFAIDLDGGNLLLYGVAGSGTTTALTTIALALAAAAAADDLHLYIIDFGTGALSPLADLPHCGAVVTAAERERAERLIRQLSDELDHRRRQVARGEVSAWPRIVVLLDGYGGFHAAFDDLAGISHRDAFIRLMADGPGVDIHVVATADRPTAVPSSVAALVPEKLLFRLADRNDAALFGLSPRDLPTFVPGRAVDVATRREVQIARPGSLVAAVSAAAAVAVDPARLPTPVATLPEVVPVVDIVDAGTFGPDRWFVPVGIGDRTLAPVGFSLHEGEGAVVSGPPQSGKSTALTAIATVVAKASGATVTGIALRRSPLRDCPHLDRLVTDAADLAAVASVVADSPGPQLVVVDDADLYDDPDGALAALLAARRPDVHVIAAGRADALRAGFTHWTKELRRSRQGVALRPQLDHDGELWLTPLPRRGPSRFEPGRGFLVGDGWAELVQIAQP
jgi:S-DNA-T family DNA segregation ATPase FtsK/SpoIIIE